METPTQIIEDVRATRGAARVLAHQAWVQRLRSRGLREACALSRERCADTTRMLTRRHVEWFSVQGYVGDRPVAALWQRDQRLECDDELRGRAERLVANGVVFEHPDM